MLLILIACKPEAVIPEPEYSPLGIGDGSQDSVAWTFILGPDDNLDDPRDLGFDGAGNLWVANRDDDRTFVIFEPGTDNQDHERRKDGLAEHFMEETAAVSFDGNAQFAACGDTDNTYNDQAEGNNYMGPVLFSTDLEVFGVADPIGLGSHLDMAHESPFCVGLVHDQDNIYWLFDGDSGNIVMNDFQEDHGIGMDEHSDTIVYRYMEPEVTRVEDAPGHLVIDQASRRLYAADTGGGRVLWLDMDSGEAGNDLRTMDAGVEHLKWENAEWGTVVEGIDSPGALAWYDNTLIVGEWGTGMLYQYDLEGQLLRSLDTGFGPEALYGIEMDNDGLLWVIDVNTGVYRIDP